VHPPTPVRRPVRRRRELTLEPHVDLVGDHTHVRRRPAAGAVGADDGAGGHGRAVGQRHLHDSVALRERPYDRLAAHRRPGADRQRQQRGVELGAHDQREDRSAAPRPARPVLPAVLGERHHGHAVADERPEVETEGQVGNGGTDQPAAAALVARHVGPFEHQHRGAGLRGCAGGDSASRPAADHDDVDVGRRPGRRRRGRRRRPGGWQVTHQVTLRQSPSSTTRKDHPDGLVNAASAAD
jgi:hypothetical protein